MPTSPPPKPPKKKATDKTENCIGMPVGMLARLDEVNRRIVSMMQYDGRRSFSSIARELGISEGAVRARVAFMQEKENLRFLAVIDPVEIGYMSWAVLCLKVQPGIMPAELAEYFSGLPETIWVAAVAGRYDLIVEVWVENPILLNQFLDDHCHRPGKIAQIETMVGMRLHKWGLASRS